MNEVKKCPFCAEEIQPEAIKCKHCGSDLNSPPPAVELKPSKIPLGKKKVKTYVGSLTSAQKKFTKDAEKMAAKGYYPISENYSEGKWGCGGFLIALLLCFIFIGILIFIYMLIVKPKNGKLVVTYEFRGVTQS